MYKFNEHSISVVRNTIKKYNLFEKRNNLIVAFSGGKDSLFLTLLLKDMGYSVYPVMLDLGLNSDKNEKINFYHKNYQLDIDIINVKDKRITDSMPIELSKIFENQLNLFYSFSNNRKVTLCTSCYNIKIITLYTIALNNNFRSVVFGHHATDALASFLKSFVMFYDRWINENMSFRRKNYLEIVNEITKCLSNGYEYFKRSYFFKLILDFAENKCIGTDEPPKHHVKIEGSELYVVRPLFDIFEHEVLRFYSNTMKKSFSCQYRKHNNISLTTPREIIHELLLAKLVEKRDYKEIFNLLKDLVGKMIKDTGELIFNVRNNRHLILGKDYKLVDGNKIKY